MAEQARARGEPAGNEQPAGHQQAIQVDQPDDAPGQVRWGAFVARFLPLRIAHARDCSTSPGPVQFD